MEQNTPNKNIINLIFNAGRGSCPSLSREVVTGELYGSLPEASRPGYRFDGWYTQSDVNGERVSEQDTVSATEDVVLYAHYTKTKGKQRKRSSYRLQKRFVGILAATIALLAVVLIGVNYFVSIIPYVDYDGAKYKARREGGVYSIYDADGVELPINEEGYYLTALGTQLSLNAATGAITEYAVVDLEGVEARGANSRILMFAQIRQADIARIEVDNQHGSFAFYVDNNGNVQIEGFETDKVLVSYDKEKYAYLCVGAGNPLTVRKLNTAEVLDRGYAEYGLVEQTRTDENGEEYVYTPTRYTVTSTSGVSHTVLIGDPIVSEAGYYCMMEGEGTGAVYIMGNATYEKALLCRVEDLITPMLTYPTNMNNYFNVKDFVLATFEEGSETPTIDLAFDYIDIGERSHTLYASTPYRQSSGSYQLNGYMLNGTVIGEAQMSLYDPYILRVCKLGLTAEALAEYGLDTPAHTISYDLYSAATDSAPSEKIAENYLLVSERTAAGSYYVASLLCDVIAEVDTASMAFVDNRAIDWVYPNIFWINLAYLREMTVSSPDYSAVLTFDNSKSDQSKAISSSDITFTMNGKVLDYIVYKTSYGTGKVTEQDPVYNLRQFYQSFLGLTIAGDTEQGHYTLNEEERAALRALPDSECQLVVTVKAEDMAATYNPAYYKENNTSTLTYRFYRYSEGRSYMTINGRGEFFVNASFVEKLIADAQRLEQGTLIVPDDKT